MADLLPISSYHDYCVPYVLEQYKRSLIYEYVTGKKEVS